MERGGEWAIGGVELVPTNSGALLLQARGYGFGIARVTHVGGYEGRFGNNFIARRNLGARKRERERERGTERRSSKSDPNCSSRSKMMDRRWIVAVNCKQSHATFRVICRERLLSGRAQRRVADKGRRRARSTDDRRSVRGRVRKISTSRIRREVIARVLIATIIAARINVSFLIFSSPSTSPSRHVYRSSTAVFEDNYLTRLRVLRTRNMLISERHKFCGYLLI